MYLHEMQEKLTKVHLEQTPRLTERERKRKEQSAVNQLKDDQEIIKMKEEQAGVRCLNPVLDTLMLSLYLHDHTPEHSLDAIAQRFGVQIRDRHTALGDSLITAEVFLRLLYLLMERGITTLGRAIEVGQR